MYTYQVKIFKDPTYLWGGEDIEKTFDLNLFLICRVDDFGESIKLVIKYDDDEAEIGFLKPNETYTIPLKAKEDSDIISKVKGVYATTSEGNVDSIVHCTIVYGTKNISIV